MLKALRQKFDSYDLYGVMQVNAAQSLIVVIGFICLNAVEDIPAFKFIIFLPVLGLIIMGNIFGYYPRLKAMMIFCFACIIYSCILCLVQNYLFLTVLVAGASVFFMFYVSRHYLPQLLGMIAMIQVIASIAYSLPNTADPAELFELVLCMLATTLLIYVFMAAFPKKYFFRVWLRSFYFTMREINMRLEQIQHDAIALEQIVSKHLIRMYEFTQGLSYREHGFAARRISLQLLEVYTSLIVMITHTVHIEPHELEYIKEICRKFEVALSKYEPIHSIQARQSNNLDFLKLQKHFLYIISTWNTLCLKI